MYKVNAKTILIVDDVPINLQLLSNILITEGYIVRPALTGKLAIQSASNESPDLIMLDICMPDMDGYEVCKRFKEIESLKDIPIIFISALDETFNKVKAFEAGGVDYVTKPFESADILARVKTQLDLYTMRRELEDKNRKLSTTLEELKGMQVKLIESEKMAALGVLTAGIAHEINNPVNFISSGVAGLVHVQKDISRLLDLYDAIDLDLLPDKGIEIKKLKEEIDYTDTREGLIKLTNTIQTGVKRTTDIVMGLKLFTRSEKKGKKLENINNNLQTAIMLLSVKANEQVAIKQNFDTLPQVLCYPGRLNQVFVNVIANAIDAILATGSAEKGAIVIETKEKREDSIHGVEITIEDNGVGISEEVMPHIFEPFYTTKEIGAGSGLGLSISHGIIKDHGGTISLRSTEGKETVCTIWLPIIHQITRSKDER